MLPALKFNLEGFQLRNHPLLGRNPPDGENSGVSGPPTEVGETQKRKGPEAWPELLHDAADSG
jgi:hypothetical protein